MPSFPQIEVEIAPSQSNDFQIFLTHHQKISSFQKNDNLFLINLKEQKPEEHSALLTGISEIFPIKRMKTVQLCQAKCRDNSSCLNQAHYDGFCSKHKH